MCLKNFLTVFGFFISYTLSFKLRFDGCEKQDGWTCKNSSDDITMDLRFSCTKEFEDKYQDITWLINNLPSATQSITVDNCHTHFIIEPLINNYKAKKLNLSLFSKLVIKNIKQLTVMKQFSGLLDIMSGNVSITFENITHMTSLPEKLILSHLPDVVYNNMTSLHFTMKHVNIGNVLKNAINWKSYDKPLNVTWNNVMVKGNIDSGSIVLNSYSRSYLFQNITDYPNNYINISYSKFQSIPQNFLSGIMGGLYFMNNEVDTSDGCGINITSKNMYLENNQFNDVKNLAFSCMSGGNASSLNFISNKIDSSDSYSIHFGAYNLKYITDENLSFFDNKFNCMNSKWLQDNKSGGDLDVIIINSTIVKYSDVNKFKEILFRDESNICIDKVFTCSMTVEKFQDNYLTYHEQWEKYCKNNSDNSLSIGSIILIVLIIVIIVGISLYFIYKKLGLIHQEENLLAYIRLD